MSSLIKLPGFTGRYFRSSLRGLQCLFLDAGGISFCFLAGCLLSYCIGTENCHLLFMDFVASDPDCRFSVEEKEERYW